MVGWIFLQAWRSSPGRQLVPTLQSAECGRTPKYQHWLVLSKLFFSPLSCSPLSFLCIHVSLSHSFAWLAFPQCVSLSPSLFFVSLLFFVPQLRLLFFNRPFLFSHLTSWCLLTELTDVVLCKKTKTVGLISLPKIPMLAEEWNIVRGSCVVPGAAKSLNRDMQKLWVRWTGKKDQPRIDEKGVRGKVRLAEYSTFNLIWCL